MITASSLKVLGIGLVLMPLSLLADTTSSTIPVAPVPTAAPTTTEAAAPTVDKPAEITKELWLEQVRLLAAVPICKSFVEDEAIAAQMKEHTISYEKCVSLIPGIAEKCEKKYDADMPLTINDENAEKWGKLIGECIGNDFATSYLYSNKKEEPTL